MANVLIVDDNADAVELSTVLLELAGHKVTNGRNGALAKATREYGEALVRLVERALRERRAPAAA
jgi:CheY-like chemotaxis protein